MRIFLTGCTGFIGSHVLQSLYRQGHKITCLVRKCSKKKLLSHLTADIFTAGDRINIIEAEWTKPKDWLNYVAGHEAVINTVGIIREKHHGDFDIVHHRVPVALFEQSANSNVNRIIQISAMGSDEQATSKFHISKREADTYLAGLKIPHTVIRPAFVYGNSASSMAFFTQLAALPITPVPGDGQYYVQPIHINDLIKAIIITIERNDLRSITVDAGGGEILTFDRMLDILGNQLEKPVNHLHIPWNVMELVAKVTDFFGGHGPITTEELYMLKRGNFSDIRKFVEFFGFDPLTFSEGIARSRTITK